MSSLNNSLTRWSEVLPHEVRDSRTFDSKEYDSIKWKDLLVTALDFKHDTFGRSIIRVLMQHCTTNELKIMAQDARVPAQLKGSLCHAQGRYQPLPVPMQNMFTAKILPARAKDEKEMQCLVEESISEFIYGDGSLGAPTLAVGCNCDMVPMGIASTYKAVRGNREGPWPLFLSNTRPYDVLQKLSMLWINVDRSTKSYPCHPSGQGNDSSDTSCSCCDRYLFRGLQADIQERDVRLLNRIGDVEYDFTKG